MKKIKDNGKKPPKEQNAKSYYSKNKVLSRLRLDMRKNTKNMTFSKKTSSKKVRTKPRLTSSGAFLHKKRFRKSDVSRSKARPDLRETSKTSSHLQRKIAKINQALK